MSPEPGTTTAVHAPEVKWVPYQKVRPHPENPIRWHELDMLYESIRRDGYRHPAVAIRDETHDMWQLLHGHQRHRVMVEHEDIQKATGGLFPIIEFPGPSTFIGDDMSATEQEILVVVSNSGRTARLRDLLDELGVPTGDGEDIGSHVAGLQAQIDQLRADTQRMVDELREEVKGG